MRDKGRLFPSIPAVMLLFLAASRLTPLRPSALGVQPTRRSDAMSLLARGAAAYSEDQLDEARRLLEEALRLDPRLARAHALIGLTLARQNAIQQALRHLARAHQIAPDNPDYAYDYAVLLIQGQRFAPAVPILESLHQKSPAAEDVLVNLARAYAGAGKFEKLSALVSGLPSTDYSNQSLLKTLATILARGRQTATVEQLWKRAIDKDPNSQFAYAALAETWVVSGRPRQALKLLAGAPAAARGPVYLFAQGEAETALHNYDMAIQAFRFLTLKLPGNDMAWQCLVTSFLLAGRLQQAEQAAAGASQRFPEITEFRYQQAVANYMLGRSSLAITDLEPVLERGTQTGLRPFLLMAVLESETGNYQSAVRYFGRVMQMSPRCNAVASYFYGATLVRMHQLHAAQAQFEAAVRCRPHFALAEYRLGQALAEAGQLRQALPLVEQATRDEPALAEPYYALAQIRRRLGDPAGAQAALGEFSIRRKHIGHSDRDLIGRSGAGLGMGD